MLIFIKFCFIIYLFIAADALRAKRRRDLIKTDPELYARARVEEADRSKQRRQRKTDQQIQTEREQSRLRMQRYRYIVVFSL